MPVRRSLVVALAALLALGGCAAAPTDPYGADGGISVSLLQGRLDHGPRIISIEVQSNRSDQVSITKAVLTTAQLSEPTVWNKGTILLAGVAIDLRTQLAQPSCPTPADTTPSVTVEFISAAGIRRTVTMVPDQPTGILAALANEDCVASTLRAVTSFDVVSVDWVAGADQPATVSIALVPTGSGGSITIHSVRSTVLLSVVAPDGSFTDAEVPIGLTLTNSSAAQQLTFRVIPNRCDTHAIAEDKRGTFFPFVIDILGQPSGQVYTTMTDDQKSSLYAFTRDYCHLTS